MTIVLKGEMAMGRNYSLLKKTAFVTSGILIISFLAVIVGSSGFAGGSMKYNTRVTAEELSKKLIRLHVIANSDSPEDQALKLSVRDDIIEALNGKLEGVDDINTSREFIRHNLKYLEEVARQKIRESGKDYSVKAVFGKFPFPVKSYGYVTLPAGDYEALRIIIGGGSGANWWCVLFPPLCFVDITHGVSKDEAKLSLGKFLTPEELAAIDSTATLDNAPVEVRFKILEWWETAVGKLKKTKLAFR